MPARSLQAMGKYILYGYSPTFGRSVILCVDLENGGYCYLEDEVEALYFKDYICYFTSRELKRFLPNGNYVFESEVLDFGTDKAKTVSEIKVDGSAKVSISNGRFTRSFNVKNGRVRPRMRGKNFVVTVEGNTEVSSVIVTAEVADEV